MKIIHINSIKQENGLWGIPISCVGYDVYYLLKDKNELILSAIIIAISEMYNEKFKVIVRNDGVLVEFLGELITTPNKFCYTSYDKYEVVGNKLYELESDEEHNIFLRKYKILELDAAEHI